VPPGRAAPVKEDRLQQQGALNVKKSSIRAAVAAVAALAAGIGWMGIAARPAAAQQVAPARSAGAPNIAMLDVNSVFKNHARFKAKMQDLDADVKSLQEQAKQANAQINKLVEQLQNYRAGSDEYKRLEEDIVKQRSEIQTRMQIQKRDVMQREAKIHYEVYCEIQQEVRYICQANNIGVVLNYSRDPINAENPDDVLRGISQKVVFSNADLDITPLVISRLSPPNRQADRSNASPARPGVGVPSGNRQF
jgi:Skp family chaperone for outer membrane proteins